jgi:glyoxalase family protein
MASPITPIPGIHHVTALGGPPQETVDFYVRTLGLRLVKKTVNFDAPDVWHLYFGDGAGAPGTILTFFPFPDLPRGREGTGLTVATSFAVPAGSITYWVDRLAAAAIDFSGPESRFDEQVVTLRDPHGLPIEIVATPHGTGGPGSGSGFVPTDHAVRAFHSVTLCVEGFEATAHLLTSVFGYEPRGTDGDRHRFVATAPDGVAAVVDLRCQPDGMRHRAGLGTVHHVAFRAVDDAHQNAARGALIGEGFNVTPVLDRQYFRSIYFREPGGILFEIATDPPGFAVDEVPETLGTDLKLPPWLEPGRERIAATLAPLDTPTPTPE